MRRMVKITKALAKKMFDNGEEVMVIPSRVRPNSMLASWTSKPMDDPRPISTSCATPYSTTTAHQKLV